MESTNVKCFSSKLFVSYIIDKINKSFFLSYIIIDLLDAGINLCN